MCVAMIVHDERADDHAEVIVNSLVLVVNYSSASSEQRREDPLIVTIDTIVGNH
jgi:hypothetical protein